MICRIVMGGLDVNREQVERGMAWVYRRYTREASYYQAESRARSGKLGLWTEAAPVPPWEFRRARKRGHAANEPQLPNL